MKKLEKGTQPQKKIDDEENPAAADPEKPEAVPDVAPANSDEPEAEAKTAPEDAAADPEPTPPPAEVEEPVVQTPISEKTKKNVKVSKK